MSLKKKSSRKQSQFCLQQCGRPDVWGKSTVCLQICLSSQKGRESSYADSDLRTPKKQREAVLNLASTGSGNCRYPKLQGEESGTCLRWRGEPGNHGELQFPTGTLHGEFLHQKFSPSFWRGCLSLLALALVGIGESLPLSIQFQVYLHAELVPDIHQQPVWKQIT